MTIEEIENKIQDKTGLESIHKAYLFACKEHDKMKRLTGEDFITHPLEVAGILLDLNVDNTTIIAALLHETINNGNATKEIISEEFGEDVASIVDSITKINKLELPDDTDSSASYLRKILVGMSEDVRVLYIKLADRLHNMRTNWAINPKKQKQKAKETMEVLIPIAHRLGINTIKSELEDLSLYYLKPEVYNDILEKLNDSREELNESLNEMKASLSDLLTENDFNFEIKARVKSVFSLYNKLQNGKKWDEIYDLLALRILTTEVSNCYQIMGLIHSKYRPMPNRFKDYIASPKENMYQSLHTTIFGDDNKVYEVQIRTYEMNEIAEKGIASHWSYKEKRTQKIKNVMEQKLEMFRNIIEASNENEEIEDAIKNDILDSLIYVYTPKGDVVELPKGSTPIDFAYRIHSSVGDTAVGAIVNDAIVPFNYCLKDGDIIKIKTNNTATPNKNWLNIVKTSQAKNKIKSYFSKKDREEYIRRGKDILEKELRKKKLSFNDILNEEKINKLLKDLKLKNEEEIYLSIGSLRYTASYIINLIYENKEEVEDPLLNKRKIKNISYKNDIIVSGIDNVVTTMAKCCNPIKGDDIIGFISKNDGLIIHKKNCNNLDLKSNRLIEVKWNEKGENYYLTKLFVYSNSSNILKDLIEECSKKNIFIESFNKKDENEISIFEIIIKVKDKNQLEETINTISKIKHIKDVRKEK